MSLLLSPRLCGIGSFEPEGVARWSAPAAKSDGVAEKAARAAIVSQGLLVG